MNASRILQGLLALVVLVGVYAFYSARQKSCAADKSMASDDMLMTMHTNALPATALGQLAEDAQPIINGDSPPSRPPNETGSRSTAAHPKRALRHIIFNESGQQAQTFMAPRIEASIVPMQLASGRVAVAQARLPRADDSRPMLAPGIASSAKSANRLQVGANTPSYPAVPIALTRKLDQHVSVTFSLRNSKQTQYQNYTSLFSYQPSSNSETNAFGGQLFSETGMFVLYYSQYERTYGLEQRRRMELDPGSSAHKKLMAEYSQLKRGEIAWCSWQPLHLTQKNPTLFTAGELAAYNLITFSSYTYAMNARQLILPYIGAITSLLDNDQEVMRLMSDDNAYDLQPLRSLLDELSATDSSSLQMSSPSLLGYNPVLQMAQVSLGRKEYEKEEAPPHQLKRVVDIQLLINADTGKVIEIAVVATRMMVLKMKTRSGDS